MQRILLFLLLVNCSIFAQQAYYNDVNLNLTGTELRDELSTKIIATHTNTLSYMWGVYQIIDLDPDDTTDSNVLLIYGHDDTDGNVITDRTRSKTYNGGGVGQWNREHTYAKSLGNPNLGTSGPGADAHHLRASDVQMNSNRGSLKFATGSGNAGISGSGWYPGDEWKGDVARMMMYMYLRYGNQCYPTGVAISSTNSVDSKMVDLFLQWNAEDPVSPYEDQRNEYLENTLNTYAQGNRNPFIDNPNLATQIWGGTPAEDRWNIVTDTESPTAPTNLVASNITNTTVDLNWTASTDNVAVTSYEIHVDGSLYDTSSTNSATLTGLTKDTLYSIKVYAKDAAGNTSAVSNTVNITTDNFEDTAAPSAITDLTSSNITSTTVDLNWTASTDNVGVTGYDIYQDGSLIASSATNSYQVTGLTPETSYDFTVFAKDAADNESVVSNTETVLTSSAPTGASDLFISEYIEGSSYNKAIEIVNITGTNIDLSNYSLKRQSSGTSWDSEYPLSGTITNGDVFVIINSQATDSTLQNEKDDEVANVTPMTFNGDDNVGLFKNGILLDIVGSESTDSGNFAKDVTLRRKSTISSPNTTYTESEWDIFSQDTTSDIGSFSSTLSTKEFEENIFTIYPNPAKNNKVTIALKNSTDVNSIQLYNLAGQLVINKKQPTISNNKIEVDNIPSGMYIVKIENNTSQSVIRLIVE